MKYSDSENAETHEQPIKPEPSEWARVAEIRAGIYGFLSTMFNERPDVDLVRNLRSIGADSLLQLGQAEDMNAEVRQGLLEISSFMEDMIEQSEEEVAQTLAVDWTRLFRGVSPSYGPPPPYEGLYRQGAGDPLELMRSINRIYHENGVVIGAESPNRPDYIGLEFDFLRLLAEQEAAAWEKGNEEDALGFTRKSRKFFFEHPGTWVGQFCDRAMEHARTGFYKGFLRLAKGVVAEESSEKIN